MFIAALSHQSPKLGTRNSQQQRLGASQWNATQLHAAPQIKLTATTEQRPGSKENALQDSIYKSKGKKQKSVMFYL